MMGYTTKMIISNWFLLIWNTISSAQEGTSSHSESGACWQWNGNMDPVAILVKFKKWSLANLQSQKQTQVHYFKYKLGIFINSYIMSLVPKKD